MGREKDGVVGDKGWSLDLMMREGDKVLSVEEEEEEEEKEVEEEEEE